MEKSASKASQSAVRTWRGRLGEGPPENSKLGKAALMTTEEAILRLARNTDDDDALIALAENNFGVLRDAVNRHFFCSEMRKKAFLTLLVIISSRAKEFVHERDDAGSWIRTRANWHAAKCKRLLTISGRLHE